jgi:hypothetical protein
MTMIARATTRRKPKARPGSKTTAKIHKNAEQR